MGSRFWFLLQQYHGDLHNSFLRVILSSILASSVTANGLRERQSPFSTTWLYLSPNFGSVSQSVQSLQSCPTLCHPMNRSTPGLPVHHKLLEFTQTHAHQVGDAIQPSHPLSSPSLPAPNPSQHQGLFQWVNSSHEMAKVLEFQLQLTLGRTPETVEILFFTVKWNNPFILCFPGTWGHSMNRLYQAGLSSKLQSL